MNEEIVEVVMRLGVHKNKPIEEIFNIATKEVHARLKNIKNVKPCIDVNKIFMALMKHSDGSLKVVRFDTPVDPKRVVRWSSPTIPLIA